MKETKETQARNKGKVQSGGRIKIVGACMCAQGENISALSCQARKQVLRALDGRGVRVKNTMFIQWFGERV